MKRKKNLPVLELTWILLFVLMCVVKTMARQTKFIEGSESKQFIHFPGETNQYSTHFPGIE